MHGISVSNGQYGINVNGGMVLETNRNTHQDRGKKLLEKNEVSYM